jgi:predicted ATPase
MPLLERESALESLGGWFTEARAGRGRLVLVGGEAGVGKTTLVNESPSGIGRLPGSCGAPAMR